MKSKFINNVEKKGIRYETQKKFRIVNFKSIIDSGECYFEPGYTVLAGKKMKVENQQY